MSDRARQSAERIRESIPIIAVLSAYGYEVRSDGGDREQQFRCDLHGTGHDSKPSARVYPDSGSWYCVAVGERVLTSQGWKELGSLEGETCPSYDGSSWQTPIAYLPRGTRSVVKVQTKAGYSVTVTPDHEIEVVGRGWVTADAINPGDEVVVPNPEQPRFAHIDSVCLHHIVDPLNQREYNGYEHLALPARWSTKLGEVFGYVFGDGWVTPRPKPHSGMVGITVHASDVSDVRDDLFPQMQAWAGGRGSESHSTGTVHVHGKPYQEDQYKFTIGNDGFCSFFGQMGLDKTDPANARRLPESIWGAPECGVRGFLRGVFGSDGSVFRPKGRKGVRVNLYSVSEPFLLDVQLLLLQFGIHSRVHSPSRTVVAEGVRKGKLTHPAGYLQIATGKDIIQFRDKVGVASRRKQALLDSYVWDPRGSRPFRAIVRSVTPAGVAVVADLSMPVEHAFVAGGIKVHNCFACDKTRDAIGTVQAREDITFWPAVKMLEKAFGLEALPFDWTAGEHQDAQAALKKALDPQRTFEDDRKRLQRFLDVLTGEQDLTMQRLLSFWEGYDKIVFHVMGPHGDGGVWTEAKGRQMLDALREKVMAMIKEHHKA